MFRPSNSRLPVHSNDSPFYSLPMNVPKRCCQPALRGCALASRRANASRRAFSLSSCPQKHGGLPVFQESSSEELSKVLYTLNAKILLPHHLNPEQKRLIFKDKNIAKLEADPIYAQIGTVEMPLEHIQRTRDIPRKWLIFKQAVELSTDQKDWENVVKMLEGFHSANIKMKEQHLLKFIRRANEAGMQHVVLNALQRVHRTGLSLKSPAILQEVLAGIHHKASVSGWENESTKKALSLAEQVVELMENPEHLGEAIAKSGDLRASPLVIAVPLELAAVRAAKHTQGEDKDGKVAKYAQRIMAAFKQDGFFENVLPKALSKHLNPLQSDTKLDDKSKTLHYHELKREIPKWIPVWYGLKTASLEVLGKNTPMAEDVGKIIYLVGERLTAAELAIRKCAPSEVNVDDLPCIIALKECGK